MKQKHPCVYLLCECGDVEIPSDSTMISSPAMWLNADTYNVCPSVQYKLYTDGSSSQ